MSNCNYSYCHLLASGTNNSFVQLFIKYHITLRKVNLIITYKHSYNTMLQRQSIISMQCTKQLSRQIWWHFGPRLGAPDYFGDRALLGSEIRSASIAALEEPRELKENPWWNRQMKKHDMKKSPLKTESCMFLEGVICLVWLISPLVCC